MRQPRAFPDVRRMLLVQNACHAGGETNPAGGTGGIGS